MESLFSQITNDPADRFECLRRFVIDTLGYVLPSDVIPREESLQKQLNQQLPIAVNEWLMFRKQLSIGHPLFDAHFAFFDFTPRVLTEENQLLLARIDDSQRWVIPLDSLDSQDPPVDAYNYVESKRKYVQRKSCSVPRLTTWAIELVNAYTSGPYSSMQGPIRSPTRFIRELREHCFVSERIGSLYFSGGPTWYATIQCGDSSVGHMKGVTLNFVPESVDNTSVPSMIRDAVGFVKK